MGERERAREGVGGGPESIRLRMWSQYEGILSPSYRSCKAHLLSMRSRDAPAHTSSRGAPRPSSRSVTGDCPPVTRAWLAKT